MKVYSKFVSVCIIIVILFGNNYSANAYISNSTTIREREIKKTIESFFSEYEDAYDNGDKESGFCSKCFTNKKSYKTETTIALIEAMLYYRIIVKEESSCDLRELNKSLTFEYNDITISNEISEVSVSITKAFYYPFSPDIESGTRDNYLISLVYESGQWKILDIRNYIDDNTRFQLEDCGVDLLSKESIEKFKRNIREIVKGMFLERIKHTNKIAKDEQRSRSTTYNGGGASQYALAHALNYNNNYASFSDEGGDCTNFVSQCMFEGGNLPMHYGSQYGLNCWFYTSSKNRSATWTSVNKLYNYIFGNKSKINATHSSWNSIGFGDIIQLTRNGSGYHSLIVSGIVYTGSSRSDLLVCAHTADRRHVSLASYYLGSTKRYINITSSSL